MPRKVLDGINNRLAFCISAGSIGSPFIEKEKELVTVVAGKGDKSQIAGKRGPVCVDTVEDLFELIMGKGQVFCKNLLLTKQRTVVNCWHCGRLHMRIQYIDKKWKMKTAGQVSLSLPAIIFSYARVNPQILPEIDRLNSVYRIS
ncbi:MAG: hypothetical protein OEL57_13770 [Trichlorobacter sp.]|uniref:hypothetical protein n=1 Tax=Trichlorobacter sp. TaxID=2911007 RepID=UPI0025641A72|nr:hypothetical protein [Trichlorobacter sp.]MDK9718951.1 hypothetical protein [Trichlorobacter sp.]